MSSAWLTALSRTVAFTCTAYIAYEIYGRGYRQQMRVVDAVWPVTALPGWLELMSLVSFPARITCTRTARCTGSWCRLGMIAGFFTAWPVNAWLIRSGIKEAA